MDAIVGFFQGVGNAIVAVFEFIVSFFSDLVFVIRLTGRFLTAIPVYFSWLPAPVLALIVTLFAIVVIYKIMGREG